MDEGVVIVGSGAAGRMAAIRAAQDGPVLLVSDGPLDRSNSMMAQGGIHVPLEDPGSRRSMADDIRRSARVRLHDELVERFVEEAADTMALLQGWGFRFDRREDGTLRRRMAGGMSEPRVLTSGDLIGPPILATLGERLQDPNVTVELHRRIVDVAPGATSVRLEDETGRTISARTVVVATGGHAFTKATLGEERTTNPRNSNDALYSVLVDRGAHTIHEDFWQYQPFGLVDGPSGPPGRCVPETVSSIGPRLLDKYGKVLYDLPADRLALTRAMFENRGRAIEGERGEGFLLTLSDVDEVVLRTEYGKLARLLESMDGLGSDVLVFPFLHYQLGGLAITPTCSTSLPNVFAAGEVTGGLHGRNRLMGAGITDALVHGWRAGASAAGVAYRSDVQERLVR